MTRRAKLMCGRLSMLSNPGAMSSWRHSGRRGQPNAAGSRSFATTLIDCTTNLEPPFAWSITGPSCTRRHQVRFSSSCIAIADLDSLALAVRSFTCGHGFQPQRIRDDADRRQRHRAGGDHRRQQDAEERVQHARGDGNTDDIVEKREEQVLACLLYTSDA